MKICRSSSGWNITKSHNNFWTYADVFSFFAVLRKGGSSLLPLLFKQIKSERLVLRRNLSKTLLLLTQANFTLAVLYKLP